MVGISNNYTFKVGEISPDIKETAQLDTSMPLLIRGPEIRFFMIIITLGKVEEGADRNMAYSRMG